MLAAQKIVLALKGKWHGRYGVARCPAHDDAKPSLAIAESEGRVLARCHAGCTQDAVISALKRLALWASSSVPSLAVREREGLNRSRRNDQSEHSRKRASDIWTVAQDIRDTLGELYLESRGIGIQPAGANALRFSEALPHPTGGRWPSLVAAITDAATGDFLGVHRTFLARDGRGKAPISPTRMILGQKRGGVIRLVDEDAVTQRIAFAEGIETALSANAAGWSCWSAIDAGNMAALPVWPGHDLSVFADNDPAGLAAAKELVGRWRAAGGSALVLVAPNEGEDWNSVLQRTRPAYVE